ERVRPQAAGQLLPRVPLRAVRRGRPRLLRAPGGTVTPTDLEAMTKRLLELEAIGFDRQEILPILSAGFKRDSPPSDWTALLAYAEDRMSRHDPELAAINRQFNVTLNRMAYIKGVLLGVFQHMVKNYNATLEGKVEHDPDPVTGEVYPVLAVKPLDLA